MKSLISSICRLRLTLPYAIISVSVFFSMCTHSAALSLSQTQQHVVANDPFLEGSNYRKKALENAKMAADYWSNPQLSSSIQNLPTNGFSLNQEPMTQFKVGIKQALPRGDVNTLKQQKYAAKSKVVSAESVSRALWLKREASVDWLNWYYASQREVLVDQERQLLEKLLEFTQSHYTQAIDGASQQDILQVRIAQLALEDKATQTHQLVEEAKARLSKWFGAPIVSTKPDAPSDKSILLGYEMSSKQLSRLIDQSEPFTLFQYHPEAQALKLQTRVKAAELAIEKEQTKAQWTVDASYGYRQDAENGASRADFVSIGVNVDLPFFNRAKQNALIGAAASRMHAKETEFRLKVNALASQAEVLRNRLTSLSEREALYLNGLKQEVEQLAASILSAYASDEASIEDVVRAQLRQVEIEETLLSIDVQKMETLIRLAYLYLPVSSYAQSTVGASR